MQTIKFITDFGDTAVLGAVVVTMSLYLLWLNSRREAAFLVISFLSGGALIAAFKIVVMGWSCRGYLLGPGIYSPSGHAAVTAAVVGSGAIIVGRRFGSKVRLMIAGLAVLAILTIAESRVILHAHTAPEAMLGTGVGVAALLMSSLILLNEPPPPAIRGPHAVVMIAMVATLTHGTHAGAERIISPLAHLMGRLLFGCG